jgi:hypothetical protein
MPPARAVPDISAAPAQPPSLQPEVAKDVFANGERKIFVDTSGYKVSSILVTPRGKTAIINGHLVRVGHRVEDAEVIDITPHEVLLEIDGQRVTLGM